MLGDATTPTTQDAAGRSTRLYDPINGNDTWLFSDYNDPAVWTLQDDVLLTDTTFTLTLQQFFDVIPGTPVPEPGSAALLCLGPCWLAAAGRRRARGIRKAAKIA